MALTREVGHWRQREIVCRSGVSQGAGQVAPRPRPRVAILTPWHPEPVDNGSKWRIRQILDALAHDYDLVLISLLAPEEIDTGAQARVPGVRDQFVFPLPTYRDRSARAILAALHPLPRSFIATWDSRVAAQIARVMRYAGVDLAIGADLRVLRYLLALPASLPRVLDEALTSPFLADSSGRGLATRAFARGRERKYARFLRGAAAQLDAVIVSSAHEATAFRQLAAASRVTVIENGVGILPEPPWQVPNSTQLLYTGALSYGPNAEAVAAFARDVLPLIAADRPDVRLLVTGKLPTTAHPAAAHPHVELSGWLDAYSLGSAYRASRVAVVPLRSGTGTRVKILEALTYGIPIVTTAKGAEGLDVTPGEHLLIEDDPPAFAAATLRLLRDDAFASGLGARGRAHVRRRYSWESRGAELRGLVGRLLEEAGRERC